ncbi:MAG: D-tyrosyl-tRNA(Tyr) deacylase [Gammaproteobacteria bacterium]|nr:D-tyrosyl-tRNA(Tyr) deacylase [Gammaproteobacteria bacterium]
MICLLQRVSSAKVEIARECVGAIDTGLLVLVGVQKDDDEAIAKRFLERMLNYRIFSDEEDKMNLSVRDIGGGLLLVPQFTLVANTRKGRRPSFTSAASPDHGKSVFYHMVDNARSSLDGVESGIFGTDMQVNLTNDGPVTFILD